MTTMTAVEKTFLDRMAQHMIAGLSFDEAAAQILEDDKRVHRAVQGESEAAAKTRAVLATEIYFNINKRSAVERLFRAEDYATAVRRLEGFKPINEAA